MDFEFVYNCGDKSFAIETSSEHRAVGLCLSSEFGQAEGLAALENLLVTLETNDDKKIELKSWVIEIEEEEVSVKHNSLLQGEQNITNEDATSYMDWETSAACGKDDFIELLSTWLSFIEEQKD